MCWFGVSQQWKLSKLTWWCYHFYPSVPVAREFRELKGYPFRVPNIPVDNPLEDLPARIVYEFLHCK